MGIGGGAPVSAKPQQGTCERAVTFRENKKNLFTARLAKRLLQSHPFTFIRG
jgi:hypothetical protein